MELTEILPAVAAAAFVLMTLLLMTRPTPSGPSAWQFPAILSGLFAAWSVLTLQQEGLFGFWTEHVTGFWGNQIWFDLLLAIGIAWFLILPRARAVGMRLPLWLLFIIATGCIGVLAMLSRLLFLENRRTA